MEKADQLKGMKVAQEKKRKNILYKRASIIHEEKSLQIIRWRTC